WLDEEIRTLKDDGVEILVSLLTGEEASYLDLDRGSDAASSYGIEFISHPITDRGIPETPQPLWALARTLAKRFAEGRSIAAHCRMGIGRPPLLLASIMVCGGAQPDDAWAAIGAARGCIVPDTLEQRDWLTRTAPPPS